jgi:transposase
LYIIVTGSQWRFLPKEYGPKSTVHGTFMQWARAGILNEVFKACVNFYIKHRVHNICHAVDAQSKKAPLLLEGGNNPTDRSKNGIKQIMMVDRKGAPMIINVAPANVHDSKLFIPLLESFEAKEYIQIIAADAAFDDEKSRQACVSKNTALITSKNPRRSKNKQKTRSPLHRWIVERTFGWFVWCRGLKICWNKLLVSHLGFLHIACSVRLFNMLGFSG